MHGTVDIDRLEKAYQIARDELLRRQSPDGCWVGCLSSSALSTATAISALCVAGPARVADRELIAQGRRWLLDQQNEDGGWGDTSDSLSNISTTLLVVAALRLSQTAVGTPCDAPFQEGPFDQSRPPYLRQQFAEAREERSPGRQADPIGQGADAGSVDASGQSGMANLPRAIGNAIREGEAYVECHGGWEALQSRYGKDRTFAVPILMNCAMAGMVEWSKVPVLPFELACLPQRFYRLIRLPVVSYAIPALVAVGQVVHHHRRAESMWHRLYDVIRRRAIAPSLRVLRKLQPTSGGYLEATPLTSFVCMALAKTACVSEPIVESGLQFLRDSMREDGSWPIDTNLSTWNTSASVVAMRNDESDEARAACQRALPWLLDCQFTAPHPYSGAEAGGWGWSSLSGAVPDADDTAGALVALDRLRAVSHPETKARIDQAMFAGARWLARLQNRDRGWPTFCKGWGKLPFDRSGTDLTAHAIRALGCCAAEKTKGSLRPVISRGWEYLERTQNSDGSWTPLWFGNQQHPKEENPVYGTAKVVQAYRDAGREGPPLNRARDWLLANQNMDGGWGARPDARRLASGESPGGSLSENLGVPRSASTVKSSDNRSPVRRSVGSGTGRRRTDAAAAGAPIPAILSRAGQNAQTSTVEETALAMEALLTFQLEHAVHSALQRGFEWLIRAVENGSYISGSPIGLYFAKLWYHESHYPLVFTVSALGEACRRAKKGATAFQRLYEAAPEPRGPNSVGRKRKTSAYDDA